MTSHILHFSVGPVQGFIGEARRARDSWAGSFLLSWLSAGAMLAVEATVEKAGGDPLAAIRFPDVRDDDLMAAVRRHAGVGRSTAAEARQRHPYIGSVPNRFKACVAPDFDPRVCSNALMSAWTDLAEAVWEAFIAEAAEQGKGGRDATRAIWDRQVANFWDIAWVMGPEPPDRSDGGWLDRRKSWRSHHPDVEEGGDHCQLMGFYQEISGWVRARGEAEAQNAFWARVRCRVGPYNLRPGERLCAIALVKRLFAALPKETLTKVIGWVPAEDEFKIRHWPSVSYVAAYPWARAAWRLAPKECEDYQRKIRALTDGWRPIDDMRDGIHGEIQPTSLTGARAAAASATEPEGEEESDPNAIDQRREKRSLFFKLDGGFFHADAIRAMEIETFHTAQIARDHRTATGEARQELEALLKQRREEAAKELEKLQETLRCQLKAGRRAEASSPDGEAKAHYLPPPRASEFYAVLRADGDHIGKNLNSPGGEKAAKEGLAEFTERVPGIIRKHTGATIYAGGDDVLALLPVDTAICAAIELRRVYEEGFREATGKNASDKGKAGEPFSWTLSVAIVFAQYHIPLRAVMEKAHEQLDGVAKDRNGRDSLALAVLKPGGIAFDWVSAWEGVVNGAACSPPETMQRLAEELQAKRELTTGFLYNIRDRYQALFHGGGSAGVGHDQMRKFLVAEYMRSGEERKDKRNAVAKAQVLIGELMRIGYPLERKDAVPRPAGSFSFDAGPLMRFLAEEGRWFMAGGGGSMPGGGGSTP